MTTLRGIVLVAGLALAAFPAGAQGASPQQPPAGQSEAAAVVPPDQQATPDQIRKFFEVARLRRQMQMMMGMLPQMVTQAYRVEMRSIRKGLPPGRQLTPQQNAALDKVLQDYMQKAMALYSVDQMMDDAIPIYQRHISRADADALIAFYSSPAGQHILDAQPVIMREYMPVEMNRMLDRSRQLTSQLTSAMQNCVKPSPTTTAPPAAKPE